MKKIIFATLLIALLSGIFFYSSPEWTFRSAQWVEQQRAGLTSQQVQIGDLTLHYYQGGPMDGEVVLLIHGFTANKDHWLRFARHLTEDYRVIALDLPGFGQSSRPEILYDVASQTQRLEQFIQALELAPLHILGNSMGGHIAALYSARYPTQVRSLGLFNNSGVNAPNPSEMFRLVSAGGANPLIPSSLEAFEEALDFAFVEPPYLPDSLQRYLAEQALLREAHHTRIFNQLRERYVPLEPELHNISVPTLLLWGDQDRVLDVSSIEVMQPLIKNLQVVVMPNVGHLPMLEQPARSAQHYRDFLMHQ